MWPCCLSSSSTLYSGYTSTVCATWPRLIHHRLAVLEQPYRKQRPGNFRDGHKCKQHLYISTCASMHDHRRHKAPTWEDTHLQKLKSYIIQGWPYKKGHCMRQYLPIRSELAMVCSIIMKGKRTIIPLLLHMQILQWLHGSHMVREKMRLLVYESVYWVNINEDIKTL